MPWSEERREQQRQIAKKLVEEGRFGGAGRGQGRPRKPRMTEKIAERIAGKGDEAFQKMWHTFMEGTDSNSIAAFRELRAIEESERKLELHDEKNEIDNMRKDELVDLLKDLLVEGVRAGVVPTEIIDGEAELVAITGSSDPSEETSASE